METQQEEEKKFVVRAYTLKEMAHFYECSLKTFRKWIRPFHQDVGPRIGHFYNPRQVKTIIEKIGKPFILIIGVGLKIFVGEVGEHKK